MTIAFLNRIRGSGGMRAFDTDVLSWRDAVVGNGGSVSLARLIIVDQFVFSEKAAGGWALTDDYWGFWAENEVQALTSLKQRRLSVAVNSPAFAPDRDYTFNGTTNYLDTGFIPATHTSAMTAGNLRIGAYTRTNTNVMATFDAGVTSATDSAMTIANRTSNNGIASRLNAVAANLSSPSTTDGRGLKAASRSGGTAVTFFDRGSNKGALTTAAPGGSLPSHSVFVGAQNNAGTPDGFRGDSIGFVVVGGSLSDVQEAAQYANVQAWATSVGANV